jgi:hypothetical protein
MVVAWLALIRQKVATQQHRKSNRLRDKPWGHSQPRNAVLRMIRVGQVKDRPRLIIEPLKGSALRHVLRIVVGARWDALSVVVVPYQDHVFLIRIRQPRQKRSPNNAEHSHVGPDPQRKRENRNDRKAFVPRHHAERITNVHPCLIKPARPPGLPRVFPHRRHATQLRSSPTHRLIPRHPRPHQILGVSLDVKLEFLIHLPVHFRRAKHRPPPSRNSALESQARLLIATWPTNRNLHPVPCNLHPVPCNLQPVPHSSSATVPRIPPITSAKWFHFFCSTSSRLRPAAVSL